MNAQEIQSALLAPFAAEEIKFRAGATKDHRALALAYVTARAVMNRLDAVFGVAGWQDTYQPVGDAAGNVLCRLRVKIDGEWIEKSDVGGESEQKDDGDKCKAAVSDALKRTAVKFGIGRYLYSLPQVWVEYDPQRKQLKTLPKLPPWALPKSSDPRGQVSQAKDESATCVHPPTAGGMKAHDRPALVSVGEASQLRKLLEKISHVGQEKFFTVFAVKTVEELPAAKFSDAVIRLNKFIEATTPI